MVCERSKSYSSLLVLAFALIFIIVGSVVADSLNATAADSLNATAADSLNATAADSLNATAADSLNATKDGEPNITIATTPTLISAYITSDGAMIGDLSGATLFIHNVPGTYHMLDVAKVVVGDGPLPPAEYGFMLKASDEQMAALMKYFAAKEWPSKYIEAINSEIKGESPFFYLVSDGSGNYGIIDGFQAALGNGRQLLAIDDDYPLGTYTYVGTVESEEKIFPLMIASDGDFPEISVPSDIVSEATSPSGAPVSYTANATDAVDGEVAVTCIPGSGTVFALGSTTVTCSATDAALNTATAAFTVTVRDTTGPYIAVPIVSASEATGADGATISYIEPAATDLVDGEVPAICDKSSGGIFTMGATTVNCSATDSRGNIGYAAFDVLVQDTTAPVISIIGDNPVAVQLHHDYADAGANALDNYDGDVTGGISTENLVNTNVTGNYNVTYSVTDTHGNRASRVRAVSVLVPMALTVRKHVVNDNGGTKTASDFLMAVSTGGAACTHGGCADAGYGSPFPFSEDGTVLNFYNALGATETYSVDEVADPGYAKSIGENCSGAVANGENRACIITNDDWAVYGDASAMNSSGFASIGVSINGTEAIGSSILGGTLPVEITDNGTKILGFGYDFSRGALDFSEITITKGIGPDGEAYATVAGIDPGAIAGTKTLYLLNASGAFSHVCIKDTEGVVDVGQISGTCSGEGETLVPCTGADTGGHACTANGTTLAITGLVHSGVEQQNAAAQAAPAPASSSPGSSNGGGSISGVSRPIVVAPVPVQPLPMPQEPSPRYDAPASIPAQAPAVAQPAKAAVAASLEAPAIPSAAAPGANESVLSGALFDSNWSIPIGVLAALAMASFVALAGAVFLVWRKTKRS